MISGSASLTNLPPTIGTSFTNSQVAFAMGEHLAKSGDAKQVYTIAPDYAAGAESVAGFVQAYEEGGERAQEAAKASAESAKKPAKS